MLDNTTHQPSKFSTNNLVDINDNSRGTYDFNNQIKIKTMILKSSSRESSDAYILDKGTITISGLVRLLPTGAKAVTSQQIQRARQK